ncbi:ribonuclease Z [Candidatus Aerophobetes bacterium]|uniref:Ribonuclease Z n=1 Tax=Aerophobetes bacterium TaxID=2030807 RepID=A0A7V5I0K4_UNCAE|nr:ribonuclease Z [Candidatus Aerophobetes bacterium]HHF99056.1 ribonuclease Z [Candidatus Aerophobetes bacterium]
MLVTILGSGVFKPKRVRYPSGIALCIGEKTIIFDAGSGTFMRAVEAGIDYEKIEHIFITHLHIDHVSDLLQYLWAFHLDRKKDLFLFGPKGFGGFYNTLTKLAPQFLNLPFKVKLKELEGGEEILLPFCKVEVAQTKHSKEVLSLCYKVQAEGKIFCYSGDTGYCEELIDFFKNADLLILECTMPDEKKIETHLSPAECAKIAKKAKVKKLVLTHLDFDPERAKNGCIKASFKEVVVAEDLMKIRV